MKAIDKAIKLLDSDKRYSFSFEASNDVENVNMSRKVEIEINSVVGVVTSKVSWNKAANVYSGSFTCDERRVKSVTAIIENCGFFRDWLKSPQ